jgi:uncharacterized protein YacL (UPF0231 family)
MSTRILSLALGGALVVLAVYHWLLVNSLNAELRAKETQLAEHTQQLTVLQTRNAALTKAADDYKAQVEDQANTIRLMQVAQQSAEQRTKAAAEEQVSQCAKQRPLIQVIKGGTDPKCAALKRELDAYIAQRQRERGSADTEIR